MRHAAPDAPTVRFLRTALLRWYRRNRRDLPWRRTSDPYCILVSETMLQQTRVSVVIPYYEKFVRELPNVAALAAAPLDDVLALWAGLGYYRRARFLKRAAEEIAARHGGEVPRDRLALSALPGVGRYTAGAVLSIAYGLREPVLDGNVFRVLSRFFVDKGSWDRPADRTRFWALAEALVPRGGPGDFNQALMELGAVVCTPRAPACRRCPLRLRCEALAAGSVDRFPAPRARPAAEREEKTLYVILDRRGRLLLVRRPERGRMAGLWDLPEEAPRRCRGTPVGSFRHSVLRTRYAVDVIRARCAASAGWGEDETAWVAREDLGSYALTGMARKAIAIGLVGSEK